MYICIYMCVYVCMCVYILHPRKDINILCLQRKKKKTDAESLFSNHMPTLPIESHVSLWESPHAEYFC